MSKSALKSESAPKLDIDLSDPGPLPDDAIEQSITLMQTGRLHRYGEFDATLPHAALLEQEFATYVGSKYAIAVNSGGCAIFLALKAAGVEYGDGVLVNAFNLAPVPGAIEHAGARAILVEVSLDYLINLNHLKTQAERGDARVLLLTHMRGHIANMSEVVKICDRAGLILIEDCAHTMGARWDGQFTGRFGAVGCFSTQTFKHINSGEGGILVTDDDDTAAKAILYSGSYMLYHQHKSAPPRKVFNRWKKQIPNYSMRMSNLAACLLRPQLKELQARGEVWNKRYRWLENRLNSIEGIEVPGRDPREEFVASSIQFHVLGLETEKFQQFVDLCTNRGLAIKWFGRDEPLGYTSQYPNWEYIKPQQLAGTTMMLSNTCDMRIPLSLTEKHCSITAAIIQDELFKLK